ncbi:probable translation initiation inhibitor [Desulfotalea psychrophila LSv54]|uniref:Probable translation initiation inhibitor n=2 Tax=Desulfotalea psychrophila TaxID=84980 RepID=Q6AN37_DESPS|nr:probable translation initiation inhibitor [Desulfotalea psychrophila LSv54]
MATMIEKKIIETEAAPAAVAAYSQAVQAGNLLFTSGQLPLDPSSGKIVTGDIFAQAHQAIKNLIAIVEAAGSSINDVIKVTVYLADIKDSAAVNEVYTHYFFQPYPARSAFQVAALPLAAGLEIEAIVIVK